MENLTLLLYDIVDNYDVALIVKNLSAMQDTGLFPGAGRSLGRGSSNLLQYSCLENPMDRGAWHVTVYGVARVRHD